MSLASQALDTHGSNIMGILKRLLSLVLPRRGFLL